MDKTQSILREYTRLCSEAKRMGKMLGCVKRQELKRKRKSEDEDRTKQMSIVDCFKRMNPE